MHGKKIIMASLLLLGLCYASCGKKKLRYPKYKKQPVEKIIRNDDRHITQHK